jgi:hypothetical protein
MAECLPPLQFTPRDRAWMLATRAAWYGEPANPPADPELARAYWAQYIATGIIKELSDQEDAR